MKTDPLENFIRQNRAAFDTEVPPLTLDFPEPVQPKPRKIRMYPRLLLQAAAAILIFAMAWVGNDLYHKRYNTGSSSAEQQDALSSAMLPEKLREADVYYSGIIEQKKQEVFRLASANPEVKKDLTVELAELDKSFRELKADLKDNTDNQEVIEAMITNYQLKLRILEDILQVLKSKPSPKKHLHETNQIQL